MTVVHKERIDLDRAEYLIRLPPTAYKSQVWNDQNDWKGEKGWEVDAYCKSSITWLKQLIELGGEKEVKYRPSKKMQTDGRLYIEDKFGVSQCKKNLRGFLCSPFYKDYDMCNAHPTILKHLLVAYYDVDFETEYPVFNEYLINREEFLIDSQLTKKQVLIYMNGDKNVKYKGVNVAAMRICKEFKAIQIRVYDLPPDLQKFGGFKLLDTGKNKYARFMNKLLVIIENQILQEVREYYEKQYPQETPVSSLIFDGFHMSKELPDQTEVLNQISDKYGVKWAIKEFDDSIEKCPAFQRFDPDSERPPEYVRTDYAFIKEQLEENCFFIMEGAEYGVETKRGYRIYDKGKFQTLAAPYIFQSHSKGYMEEHRIFYKWEEDKNRRKYDRIDFVPDLDKCPEDVYNTFKGFAYSDYNELDFSHKQEAIDLFKKQISILANHEEHVVEYFINYFAHMFQKPCENPGICLVLKSREGWGKDILTTTLNTLMGNNMGYKTGDAKHIFGSFNTPIKNKLLIQLNELSGKDGFGYKDTIKDFITADSVTINEKGKNQYQQTNYARWIFCTNNLTPIELKTDSRRFVVVSAQHQKPPREHFEAYLKMLDCQESLYTLAEYLCEKDLTMFDPRQIPVTAIAKDMAIANTSPIYLFLNEILTDDKYKEMFEGEYDEIYGKKCFAVTPFRNLYQQFCLEAELQFQQISTKVFYALMNEIGIKKTKLTINGEQAWRIIIDVKKTTEALVNLIVKE